MTTETIKTARGNDHVHYFNYATGRPRFHFDEGNPPSPAPAPAPEPAPTPAPAPAPTPEPAPAPAPTILNNPQPEPAPAPAPADWPADWRDRVATQVKPGDTKFRERLERLGSPVEITKSWLALEQKMSSGDFKQALPKDAKPEQIAAWRKDNGVPEKPENYSIELPGGIKFDEDDKPLLDAYLAQAHADNWSQDKVTEGLTNLHKMRQGQAERLATFDTDNQKKGEDSLRAEWGPDYRRNVNAVDNLVATMPEDLAAAFINGRLADGTKIGADPRMIRWLSSLAADYPSLVSEGGDVAASAESRLSELRTMLRDRSSAYYKGPDASKLQAEYRNLLDGQNRRKARAA